MKETNDLLTNIRSAFHVPACHPGQQSPLNLAYIGDAVYEIILRTILVESGPSSVNSMHRRCSSLVNAKSQAETMKAIQPHLSSEESAIFRRGRNAKPHTMAKHASIQEYRTATGLEALIGYLYLSGQITRCTQLIHLGLTLTGKISPKTTPHQCTDT